MDKMPPMAAPLLPCRQDSPDSGHYWSTWEKLLLASAVKRHGTDKWSLVSAELQARTTLHFASRACFTPEACRSEYYNLKGRYSRDGDREEDLSNDMPWFEELRKLRVNQLKRELQHYDNSIGSLESKLKRLKFEREKSLQSSSNQCAERAIDHVANACKADAETSLGISEGLTSPHNCRPAGKDSAEGRASGMSSSLSRQATEHPREEKGQGCVSVLEETERGKLVRVPKISLSSSNVNAVSSDHERCGEGDVADTSVVEPNVCQEERRGQPVSAASNFVGILAGSQLPNGGDVNIAYGEYRCPRDDSSTDRGESKKGRSILNGSSDIQIGVQDHGDLSRDDVKSPQPPEEDGFANARDLMAINRGHLPKATGRLRTPFDTLGTHHDGSETASSPGHKYRFALKHWGGADASVLVKTDSCKRMCLPVYRTVDSTCRVSGNKSVPVYKQSIEVQSEDGTEDNQQVLAVLTNRQAHLHSNDRTHLVFLEAASNEDHQKVTPGSLLTTNPKLPEQEVKASSTGKSELREFCGESAEVGDSRRERLNKVTNLGKRRKIRKSIPKDVVLAGNEEIEATNLEKPVNTSMKIESLPASHVGTESLKEQGGQEANDPNLEEWHQTERFSGDSRVEKSELSSFMDGNDDISPMSRRNKREPKVPGNLVPLLRCFKTISCHKCAHLFKRSPESQDDPRYDCLIRVHVDLGMIRCRLEEEHYLGSMHFFRDLLLMVNNALVYYPRDSQEFLAATELRACIVKQMSNVLKTEALLKQNGPCIRKRNSKMGVEAVKAGRSLTGKQGKRKGFKRSQAKGTSSRDAAVKLRMHSDIANVCDLLSGDQHHAVAVTDADVLQEGTSASRNAQNSGTDGEISQKEPLKGQKIPDEWRVGNANSVVMGVMDMEKEPGLGAVISSSVKEVKDRGNMVDSRYPLVNRKGSLVKAVNLSKTPVAILEKGVEDGFLKTHDTAGVPGKRGVGRPPKNSQQQVSLKTTLAEAPNSRRKWVRW